MEKNQPYIVDGVEYSGPAMDLDLSFLMPWTIAEELPLNPNPATAERAKTEENGKEGLLGYLVAL